LRSNLAEQGVAVPELAELEKLLVSGETAPQQKRRVGAWVKRVSGRIAAGAGRIGESAVNTAISAAIATYLNPK
jgi:hypothetical protein